MDRLQSMRVFQRVIDEGGFAAAARRLNLDPAVVTRLVADLEKHLGSRLLQRTTRRFALTPAGEEYLLRLRTILSEIDEADASVKGQTTELRGRIRILTPAVVATHLLAPVLADFHGLYPEIQIDIRALDMLDPPYEEYDLTFVEDMVPIPADIVVREVVRSHAVLCASPAYLKRHGVPRKPEDLQQHRILSLRTAGGRAAPLRLLDPAHADVRCQVDVTPALTADHTDTLLRATLDGAGISTQVQELAAPRFNTGQLRRVLAPWITERRNLLAAFPSRRFLPARARVFLDHLIGRVRAEMSELDVRSNQSEVH